MPETLTAPIEDKIEFVTAEQAQQVDKMMLKDWVKVGADGKPTKSKEFIYRIISAHPYEKRDIISPTGKFLIKLEVQKFYRNKMVTKNVQLGGQSTPQKENMKVLQHEYSGVTDNKFDPGGNWVCVDEDANRQMDMRQFLAEFAPDIQQ